VIEAEPEANVVLGLVRPVRRDEFAAAVTSVALEALLRRLPVAAGDTVLVTAGTIHTIGPGILLYEIQQKSDLTYRVYDFDRADPATGQRRELHLAKALDVAELGPAPLPAPPVPVAEGRELLTSCPSFALERWSIQRPVEAATDDATLEILTVIDGSIRLRWNGPAIDLQRGATTVLPASLGRFALEGPADGGATLLRAYVPES
jgi:mannose-6-phosphate isomerase